VEGRIVVVEVIILARIDIDVVRLGVRDDGEVVVLAGEDLIQPLRPLDRDDLGLDADLAQLRGDDLAAKTRIGGRRQLYAGPEAVLQPGFPEQLFRPGDIMRVGAGKIDIGFGCRRLVRTDGSSEPGRSAVYDRLPVERIGNRLS